ncbi:hypothetical protein Q428_04860 [Fervidicella metallireducens AeB]|uniref:Uncharacterized protein n=1 Tax=Fervidicella metallireducens AeB TaxID=1403537 RepID=A0A017RX61_9CLOT|nr:hypothetical protein Q428_04860 [Fervidicella metallireducens AeB]
MLVLAFMTETLWETLKMIKSSKGINIDRIGAMILGILIAIAANMDIFKLIEIPLGISYLGSILTGLLISRGANFLHDILGNISSMYQARK